MAIVTPLLSRLLLVAGLVVAGPAAAHEFWISPDVYRLEPGQELTAEFRIGQMFKGATRSYVPRATERFEAGPAAQTAPVEARLGDRPALRIEAAQDGLWLVVHETMDTDLTYNDWDLFADFDAYHDLGGVARHRARGLPETGFRESYRRFAKALVAVGDGEGVDRRVGLDVEIVMETNPYTAEPGTPMVVRGYQDGVPRGDAQLEVFRRDAAGEVSREVLRSDAGGAVTVASEPGSEVMLNFVTLDPLDGDPAANEPVWHSRWASLTYAVPAAD